MNLKGKKILFISNQFFNYYKLIQNKFEELGAMVDYYDERPSNSFFVKAFIRFGGPIVQPLIDSYHSSIINKTKDQDYDYFILIRGEAISPRSLEKLRANHPNAKFILYLWDSIANNIRVNKILNCFDAIYSFDRVDCLNFGYKFLPLFYPDDYSKIKPKKVYSKNVMFVGTIHTDRLNVLNRFKYELSKQNCNFDFYYYLPSKWIYYVNCLINRDFRNTKITDFNYKSIGVSEIYKRLEAADILLDIERTVQSGLTMRPLEILGASRKLITTNKDVVNYDFYNPNNICVVSRNNISIPKEFIDSPYVPIAEETRYKYSLRNWAETILQ